MKRFDAHIHLEKYADQEIEQFLSDPELVGVMAVSMDLPSSHRTIELKKKHTSKIYTACGFHPEQPAQDITMLIDFIYENQQEIDAIGEIGLPYYTNEIERSDAEDILRKMLLLAAELKKPVILHAVREDVRRVYQLLQEYQIEKAHFHWIKADTDMLDLLASAGYYVSFTPDIWYKQETASIAVNYPLKYMMVETDGPWGYEGPFKGIITTPKLIEPVVQRLANLRGFDPKVLSRQFIVNSYRFLGQLS